MKILDPDCRKSANPRDIQGRGKKCHPSGRLFGVGYRCGEGFSRDCAKRCCNGLAENRPARYTLGRFRSAATGRRGVFPTLGGPFRTALNGLLARESG